MLTKICNKCKEEKSLFFGFYKNPKSKDGFGWYCKVCHSSYNKDPIKRKLWSHTYHIKTKTQRPELYLWKQARQRAKFDYRCEFSISVEDIIIPTNCPYLGIKLDVFKVKDQAPSLDRRDPTKGYTKDNIQVISWQANRMKSNATPEQLIAFAKGVLVVHSKEGRGCANQG